MGRYRLLSLFVCGLMLGCQNDNSSKPNAKESAGTNGSRTTPANGGESSNPRAGKRVTAEVMSFDETLKLVKAQQGKVVVLDFWSTRCRPCLVEFPGLVALHKKHGDKVTCISLSLDYYGGGDGPDIKLRERVLAVLTELDSTLKNIICSTEDDEVYAHDQVKFFSIPAIHVYDQTGRLRKLFSNENKKKDQPAFSYEKDIAPFVEQLLAEKN